MSQSALSSSERKLKAIWELAGDAMVFLDADGVLDCNDAALRLFGIDSLEEAIGLPPHLFAPPTQADGRPSSEAFVEGRQRVIASGVERFDWQFQRADGAELLLDVILHAVHMGGGEIVHGILRDVTADRLATRQLENARRVAENSLRHLSRQDALTGLPNRALFLEEGQRRIDSALQPDRVCLLYIDVDNFRRVNDVFGETIGDAALRAIGERLGSLAGQDGLLARLGSDEFALLLTDCAPDAAAALPARLAAEQEQPLALADQPFNVTVSVGVACPGATAQSLESLLQQAAMARNVSRQARLGGWQTFAETMNVGIRDRWQLESELRTALEGRQFVLHYEPQVDLQTNRIVGVEALVRWQNPRLGLVEPASFIALAEEIGMIDAIGEWVLFEACRQNQHWLARGLPPIHMSVNVAARQFRAGLTAIVRSALGEARLSPEWLTLEMTEGTLMDGSSDTIAILTDLRNQGISLAIDDFGTGYSSLSYLKRFPLDRLKVDQSFIRDIDRDPDNLAIASAIINLGHTLRLNVIAEGVETAAELELLRQNRCDQAQGFYFARALPAADMEALLRSSVR